MLEFKVSDVLSPYDIDNRTMGSAFGQLARIEESADASGGSNHEQKITRTRSR